MYRTGFQLIIAWLLWGGWTILVCFLLLSPSEGTAIRDLSLLFGGSEVTDAIGHVVMIFFETAFFYNLLKQYVDRNPARNYAIRVTLVFGLCVEFAQYGIATRDVSVIDVFAAFLGVGLFAVIIKTGILNDLFDRGSFLI